jgi:hypothetical protein
MKNVYILSGCSKNGFQSSKLLLNWTKALPQSPGKSALMLFPATNLHHIEYLTGVLGDMIVTTVIFVKISLIVPGFVVHVGCVTISARISKKMYA